MLSIPKVQQLIDDENISDKEAEAIRDTCQGLVELTFEVMKDKKNRKDFYEQYGKSNKSKET